MNAGRFLRVDERLLYKPDPYNEDRYYLLSGICFCFLTQN